MVRRIASAAIAVLMFAGQAAEALIPPGLFGGPNRDREHPAPQAPANARAGTQPPRSRIANEAGKKNEQTSAAPTTPATPATPAPAATLEQQLPLDTKVDQETDEQKRMSVSFKTEDKEVEVHTKPEETRSIAKVAGIVAVAAVLVGGGVWAATKLLKKAKS